MSANWSSSRLMHSYINLDIARDFRYFPPFTYVNAIIRRVYTLVDAACSDTLHAVKRRLEATLPPERLPCSTCTAMPPPSSAVSKPFQSRYGDRPKPRMQNAKDLRAPNSYRGLHADPTIERPVYCTSTCKYIETSETCCYIIFEVPIEKNIENIL